MSRKPVLEGEITDDGVFSILAEVEQRRTTGVLAFTSASAAGEVRLVTGQLALEQPDMGDGGDPVELFLGLREGTFAVHQCLPTLPVSQGNERARHGSLAVHVPADLMGYCEMAGLTGLLTLEKGGQQAEAVYDRGDLVAIHVDGTEDDDLHDVFAWEEGHFEITAHSEPPAVADLEPSEETDQEGVPTTKVRKLEETGLQFLRSVEMTLSSIVDERQKRRPATRASPPMPATPKVRPPTDPPGQAEAPSSPRPRTAREATVKIIYRGSRGSVGTEDLLAPSRSPEEVPATPEGVTRGKASQVSTKEKRASAPDPDGRATAGVPPSILDTLAWVLVTILVFIAALGLLASLAS